MQAARIDGVAPSLVFLGRNEVFQTEFSSTCFNGCIDQSCFV